MRKSRGTEWPAPGGIIRMWHAHDRHISDRIGDRICGVNRSRARPLRRRRGYAATVDFRGLSPMWKPLAYIRDESSCDQISCPQRQGVAGSLTPGPGAHICLAKRIATAAAGMAAGSPIKNVRRATNPPLRTGYGIPESSNCSTLATSIVLSGSLFAVVGPGPARTVWGAGFTPRVGIPGGLRPKRPDMLAWAPREALRR